MAVLYSVVWCRNFKTKLDFAVSDLTNFKQLLQKVYIDDNTNITTPTPPGTRLNENGKIVIVKELIEAEREIPADERAQPRTVEQNCSDRDPTSRNNEGGLN